MRWSMAMVVVALAVGLAIGRYAVPSQEEHAALVVPLPQAEGSLRDEDDVALRIASYALQVPVAELEIAGVQYRVPGAQVSVESRPARVETAVYQIVTKGGRSSLYVRITFTGSDVLKVQWSRGK